MQSGALRRAAGKHGHSPQFNVSRRLKGRVWSADIVLKDGPLLASNPVLLLTTYYCYPGCLIQLMHNCGFWPDTPQLKQWNLVNLQFLYI